MDIWINIFNILVLLILGCLFYFMPKFMGNYSCFGVTINDEILKDERIADYKKSYAKGILLFTFCVIAISIALSFIMNINAFINIFVVLVFAQIIVTYQIYYNFHKKVKEIKNEYIKDDEEVNVIAYEIDESKEFKIVPYIWFIVYIILIGITAYITLDKYDSLPAKIVTQIDGAGNPSTIVDKSYGVVMMMPLVQLFLTITFVFTNMVFKITKKVSGISKTKVSFEQERKYRYYWSIALYVMGIVMLLIMGFAQLSIIEIFKIESIGIISLIAVGVILVGFIVLAFITGQNGARIKDDNKKNEDVIEKDDDNSWIGGIIYFNKNDPSVFVPKRFSIGTTLNFASPYAWLFFGVIIAIVVVTLVISL